MRKFFVTILTLAMIALVPLSGFAVGPGGYITTTTITPPTYGVSVVGLTPVTKDLFTLQGSATKTIMIRKIIVSGVNTSAATTLDVSLVKRTAANSGGTSASVTPALYDSVDSAATAVLKQYSADTTTPGTGIILQTQKLNSGLAGAAANVTWDFNNTLQAKPVILHGTSEWLAINLNAEAVTNTTMSVTIEWTEF